MCGLYSSIGFTPERPRIDIVSHRGPDGDGWKEFHSGAGPVALGHRRLAIIDVSDAGSQPMADQDGRYQIVFNGEIYNYLELRKELQGKGCRFITNTDTEVLLRAYVVWGEACLTKLRGMFAFVIWDTHAQVMFAARDRFGIKPLYWVKNGERIAFASEIKQLLGLQSATNRTNGKRAYTYLLDGVIDHTGDTLFENVSQLRGGEAIWVDAKHATLNLKPLRWYNAETGERTFTSREAANTFRELFADSIKLHLRSDVAIGSCLSGGLDSSAIVCSVAKLLGANATLNTVSACYPNQSIDEKRYVDIVAAHARTVAHIVYPGAAELYNKASEITWYQDEPFGSTSIFAQWCVFKEARKAGVKVMLDGQGADEQLAGYSFAFTTHQLSLLRNYRLSEAVGSIWARHQTSGVTVLSQLMRLGLLSLPLSVSKRIQHQYRTRSAQPWLSAAFANEYGDKPSQHSQPKDNFDGYSARSIGELCSNLTFNSNLPMLLHWEDRNSMAHGIEARVPFLDHPLVEFSLALGDHHKIYKDVSKKVLRDAMVGTLPDAILNRRDKLGFATPEFDWFRRSNCELLTNWVDEALNRYPNIFDARTVRSMRDQMLNGQQRYDPLLWRIANFGIWGKRFSVSA